MSPDIDHGGIRKVSIQRPDIIVVGAGPAGLNAALEGSRAGCSVLVIDANARIGGQYHRQPLASAGARAPDVITAALADPFIEIATSTTVYAATARPQGGATLQVLDDSGAARSISAEAIVLATGSYDRALPFPGWTLPGVFTAGGAQALVKGSGVLPGNRVLIGGTGPFLLPVAAALAEAGARVVGVLEAGSMLGWGRHLGVAAGNRAKVGEAVGYGTTLLRHRIPLHRRTAIVAVQGDRPGECENSVTRATVARLDRRWRPIPGSQRTEEVDAVCVGFGFIASVELAVGLGCALTVDAHGSPVVSTTDSGASTVAGVYCAGEVSGVGGVVLAYAEGALAGMSAAAGLGRTIERRRWSAAAARRRRSCRFADALDAVYPIGSDWTAWMTDDTVVCRCEEVSTAKIRAALDHRTAADLRSVKLHTRAGMGRCQGRMCVSAVSALVRTATGAPPIDPAAYARRPLAVPIPLGALARVEQGLVADE